MIKKFFNGGINTDDDPRLMDQSDYLNMENCRMAVSEHGVEGRVDYLSGMDLVATGNAGDITKGACLDLDKNRIIFFNYNSTGSTIYCLDGQTLYTVLDSADVDNGLDFTSRIYGRVVNGLLYWIQSGKEPKRINYEAAIKANHPTFVTDQTAYTFPLSYSVTTVIRKTLNTQLVVTKQEDTLYENNFIKDLSMMFFMRFTYRDGEVSVLSTGSDLVNYNFETETFNYVNIKVPLEQIEQDVEIIELVVKYMDSNKYFVIKSWDKKITSEATAINNHNSGTTQLSFNYYGDLTGYPIQVTKIFDSVPLESKAIEIARNRLFLGNNLVGYDTPTKTSLTSSVVTVEDGGELIASWYRLHIDVYENGFRDDPTGEYDVWVARIDGHTPLLYYFDSIVYPLIPPSTITLGTADFSCDTVAEMADYILGDPAVPRRTTFTLGGHSSSVTDSSGGVSTGTGVFKSNGAYHIGLIFLDEFKRRCGVLTTDTNKLIMPSRDYAQTVYNSGINWSVSNTDAVNEIPSWAKYYQIVRTLNLNTRFFVQARTKDVTYVNKANDGTYTYTDTYAASNYGLAFDTSFLTGYGIGYNFNEGDLLIFYQSPGLLKEVLKITGQDGPYVHTSLLDLGNTNLVKGLFEIYTPHRRTEDDIFFGVGDCYEVLNPGTTSRSYSVESGVLSGDVNLIIRDSGTADEYFVEAMSPYDKFWKDWYTDCNGANIITKDGQKWKKGFYAWSEKYIPGTSTNGLSSFEALAQDNVPIESGEIMSLQLATKTQEDGSIMLAICRNEALSMYLGEVQLNSNQGGVAVVTSNGVVGSVNSLKGRNGTQNPESVYEYNGVIFWADVRNGSICQYSINGIDYPSRYKTSGFWSRFGRNYTTGDILMCVDPVSKELLVKIPSTETSGFSGVLPGFSSTPSYASSIDNRYSFYDGKSKTVVFNLEANRWRYSLTVTPECMIHLGNNLYAFKNGSMWRMNADENDKNSFFGTKQPARVCYSNNGDFSQVRAGLMVSIESAQAPSFTHLYTSYPNIQSTDLSEEDYDLKEGVFYADIKRDRLSGNVSGGEIQKLYFGDRIRAVNPNIMVEFSDYSSNIRLNFVNIGDRKSSGHKV